MVAVLTQLVYLKYRAGSFTPVVVSVPFTTHRVYADTRTTHRARGDINTTHRVRGNIVTTHRIRADIP